MWTLRSTEVKTCNDARSSNKITSFTAAIDGSSILAQLEPTKLELVAVTKYA